MRDWAAGLTVLSVAFVGTVVITIGLAAVVVPGGIGASAALDTAAPSAEVVDPTPAPLDAVPAAIGGTLTVRGDREGTLVLDREDAEVGFVFDEETETAQLEDGPYRLSGSDGQVAFDVDPLYVEQIDFDGLSFYPEPDECEITAGSLNPRLGIASAALRCEDIADIRDNGVVTFDGTIQVAGDVLGMRGDLPATGGSVTAGPTTFELPEARLLLEPFGFDAATGRAQLPLFTADGDSGLIVEYDVETHELTLGVLVVGGEFVETGPGDCSVDRNDLGILNPRTSVVELSVHCDSVDVPGLGAVPVDGSFVADLTGIDAPP